MAVYDAVAAFPKVDFSILGNIAKDFDYGAQSSREDALRQAFQGGLPRGADGEIDWNKAINMVAQTGNIGTLRDLGAVLPFANEMASRRSLDELSKIFGGGMPGSAAPAAPAPAPAPAPALTPHWGAGYIAQATPAVPPGYTSAGYDGQVRPKVASTPKVMGDDEGVAAGIYEPDKTAQPARVIAQAQPPAQPAMPVGFQPAYLPQQPQASARFAQAPSPIASDETVGGGPTPGAWPGSVAPPAYLPAPPPPPPPRPPPPSPRPATVNPAVPNTGVLMRILADPHAAPGAKQAAMAMFQEAMNNAKLTDQQKNYRFYLAQGGTKTFEDFELDQKRAAATAISTSQGFEDEQKKMRLAIDRQTGEQISQQIAQSRKVLPLYDQVIELAGKTPTGILAQIAPTLANNLQALGIAVPAGFTNAQMMLAIQRQLVPSVRDPGSTSNWEGGQYLAAVPGLAQTAEGRILIASMNKALHQRNVDQLKIIKRYGGTLEIDDKLNELDNRPLFTDAEKQRIEDLTAAAGNRVPMFPSAAPAPGSGAAGSVPPPPPGYVIVPPR